MIYRSLDICEVVSRYCGSDGKFALFKGPSLSQRSVGIARTGESRASLAFLCLRSLSYRIYIRCSWRVRRV